MKRGTLIGQILLAFLVTIMPLSGLLLYSTLYSMDVIREQVSITNRNLLNVYMEQVDSKIEAVDKYLYKTVSYNQIQLGEDIKNSGDFEYIMAKYGVLERLRSDILSYPFLQALFIYNESEKQIIRTASQVPGGMNYYVTNTALAEVAQSQDLTEWTVVLQDSGALLIRMIPVNGDVYIGAYFAVQDIIPQNMSFTKGSLFTVTDRSSRELAGDDPIESMQGEKGGDAKQKAAEESGLYSMAYSYKTQEKYLLTSVDSEYAPISFRLSLPEQMMMSSLVNLQYFNSLVPALLVLVLTAYFILLRRSILRPVKSIVKAMNAIAEGNWSSRIKDKFSGEFFYIANGFNNMAEQVCNLKISMYDEKIRAQNAEYKQLQMQINPHFYMNSLNIVYNMAALKDYKNVQKMALYLANHFKFIVKNTKQLVRLDAELEYTKNYLEINRLRFGDNLGFHIDIQPVYNSYMIPMLTVQTFVENCVMHGFVERSVPFYIFVRVYPAQETEQKDSYVVEICDTGKGFPADFLKCYNQKDFLDSPGKHVGIKNTVSRLKLRYGNAAQAVLANREEGGAMVRLVLPVKPENTDSEEK